MPAIPKSDSSAVREVMPAFSGLNTRPGMNINIRYRRKKRGITMSITRHGQINVSAPTGTPLEQIEAFVRNHHDWIAKALERTSQFQKTRDAFFAQLPLSTADERAEAARRMHSVIPPLIERHSKEMGVEPGRITYTAARTRWGSCNPATRHVNFSVYMLLLPHWCIEHVVVHELAHLIVPNHSPAFYRVMDRHFPLWKEARSETRRIARMAESDGQACGKKSRPA